MNENKLNIKIIENSYLAYIASICINSSNAAIVFKNTIFIYNVSTPAFVNNRGWLLHELKHVQQYQQFGAPIFLTRYLFYTMRYGYYNNPYEIEARNAESDNSILDRFDLSAYGV